MGRILDHQQLILLRDFVDGIQIAGLSGKMYGDNGLGFFRDFSPNILGVDIVGFGVDVRKNGFAPAVKHAIGGSGKGQGRGDDFISLSDSRCQAGHMQGRRSVGHRHRIFGSHILRQGLFKLRHLGPRREIVRP